MDERVRTGEHFVSGNWACAEGAVSAGCGYYAAYPITPATEIAERLAERLPGVGGRFVQFEDEIGAIVSVIGASYAGLKSMTATSGPGFSLMLENIGLAVMTEAPCVVVDVMRGGPSTGQPTSGSQGDVMQCRWGIHGDAEIIALAPKSVQEMYDLTVEVFNLSEAYRVPVFILSDANIGHTYETLVIPPEEDLEIVDRKRPRDPPGKYLPFKADEDLVPPMASFGEGHRFYATGLTHDERGYPDASPEAQDRLVRRLCDKIRRNRGKIIRYEEDRAEDCDVLVFAYGTTARSAASAVQMARGEGLDAGLFRPVTLWPFPDERLMELAGSVRGVVVAEMNYGQLVREVERAMRPVEVSFLPTLGENPPRPEEILGMIRRVAE